jgi:hypothetical protein
MKLDYSNRFKVGELYEINGQTLKFVRYSVGGMLPRKMYVCSDFFNEQEDIEEYYNTDGFIFDIKPKSIGANFIKINNNLKQRLIDKYSSNSISYWENRAKEIIETGLVTDDSELMCNPTENSPESLFLYEEYYGIKLWLLYSNGYLYLE